MKHGASTSPSAPPWRSPSSRKRFRAYRVGYLETCYRDLGWPKRKARSQAVFTYATYLGFLHLRVEGSAELPRGRDREASYTAMVAEALIPPEAP